ncbi:MAG TPA: bifunctional diaminohydroxyphosphoribosylaminopyrimidine deaminase/5-amino-6-(5-phosphoribosylamino)uracil reductase RibD [Thermomicrobiales bacterium]|nr:bifunctional diaminohydroxyphosphoribosylaminopyrimidine deaminase/5-amino-6-(5-phosphoribosylamino)uracil reductase RibD [Thermomicrobiales bacterium]
MSFRNVLTDTALMALALDQARSMRGRVAPNPAVGAVVARDGVVIATGATQPPPGPHAEVVALDLAGAAARGADLFVTLEPCAHTGRTPPCVGAIIAAGIRRVVLAVIDPNPLVAGRGVAALQASGIQAEVGLLAGEAAEIIAGFSRRMATGRPLVTAKYAMTLDGRIATRTGHARWISGPESRAHSHIIRDQIDAIMAGSGTVIADDPLLTTRAEADQCGQGGPHHPLRVILDSRARTPPSARMLAAATPGRTLIVTGPHAPTDRVAALIAAGAEVVAVDAPDGRVSIPSVLDLLGEQGINDLLVEGGGRVHGAFFDGWLVDRLHIYISPQLVGGEGAKAPVGGLGVATMDGAARLHDPHVERLGDDLFLRGSVVYPEGGTGDV